MQGMWRKIAIAFGFCLFAVAWGICVMLFGPAGFVIALTAVLLINHFAYDRPRYRTHYRIAHGRCPQCGYDLRGSKHACICPECGRPFEIYGRMRFSR
jgi:hypothetical protein